MDNTYSDIYLYGHYDEIPDEFFISPETYYDVREYYKRYLGPSWSVSSKKSAMGLLTVSDHLLREVIIQRMGKFYVFVDDPDISEFQGGGSAVNEIIPKHRHRYPTIDVDSKTPSLAELLLYFHDLVDSINDV